MEMVSNERMNTIKSLMYVGAVWSWYFSIPYLSFAYALAFDTPDQIDQAPQGHIITKLAYAMRWIANIVPVIGKMYLIGWSS